MLNLELREANLLPSSQSSSSSSSSSPHPPLFSPAPSLAEAPPLEEAPAEAPSPSPSLEELAEAAEAPAAALADAEADAAAAAAAAAEAEELEVDPGSTVGGSCASHVHSAHPVLSLFLILATNPIWQEQSGAKGQRSSHSESLITVHQNVVA